MSSCGLHNAKFCYGCGGELLDKTGNYERRYEYRYESNTSYSRSRCRPRTPLRENLRKPTVAPTVFRRNVANTGRLSDVAYRVAGAAGLPHSTNPLRVAEARDPGAFGPVSGPLSVVAV